MPQRRPLIPHIPQYKYSMLGVLLLNAVLTVNKGEPNSHKGQVDVWARVLFFRRTSPSHSPTLSLRVPS